MLKTQKLIHRVLAPEYYEKALDVNRHRAIPMDLTQQYQSLIWVSETVNQISAKVESIKQAKPLFPELILDLSLLRLDPYNYNQRTRIGMNSWPFDKETMRNPIVDLGYYSNDNLDDAIKLLDQYQFLLLQAAQYFWDANKVSKLQKVDGYHLTLGHYLANDYVIDNVDGSSINSPSGAPVFC